MLDWPWTRRSMSINKAYITSAKYFKVVMWCKSYRPSLADELGERGLLRSDADRLSLPE